jgi:cephalosporin hydroxylase
MIKTKYYTFEGIKSLEYSEKDDGKWATQLMKMYRVSSTIEKPTILELGVQTGTSTTVLLQACEENDGCLTSVDVKDCSDVSNSPKWKFILSDSTNKDYIINQSNILNDGIDILYVDTIHKVEHVSKEINQWFPLLKKGSWVFFDDLDAYKYRPGHVKRNRKSERDIDNLRQFVMDYYHANESQFYFEIMYGSTGMGCLHKISEKGVLLNKV